MGNPLRRGPLVTPLMALLKGTSLRGSISPRVPLILKNTVLHRVICSYRMSSDDAVMRLLVILSFLLFTTVQPQFLEDAASSAGGKSSAYYGLRVWGFGAARARDLTVRISRYFMFS